MDVAAKITDEKHSVKNAQYMQSVIHRSLHGRWPILKSYGMRRDGLRIHCVARWLRTRTNEPYCVVTWNIAELGMHWHNFRTLAEARKYAHTLL